MYDRDFMKLKINFSLFWTFSLWYRTGRNRVAVLPRGILNTTTWLRHVAVHQDAVIAIHITYYLLGTYPLTYLDSMYTFPIYNHFLLLQSWNSSSPNIQTQNEKIACTRGRFTLVWDHGVYGEIYRATFKRQHVYQDIKVPDFTLFSPVGPPRKNISACA